MFGTAMEGHDKDWLRGVREIEWRMTTSFGMNSWKHGVDTQEMKKTWGEAGLGRKFKSWNWWQNKKGYQMHSLRECVKETGDHRRQEMVLRVKENKLTLFLIEL